MALSYVDVDAGKLLIPGAYPTIKVQASNSGLSTTGVLMIVGEADAGPDYTLESDLASNAFSPDQAADVVAKYKSGNLVDAFNAATSASNDPDIPGAFSQAILVKTNKSLRATSILLDSASAQYCQLSDTSYGALGNLLSYAVVSAVTEAMPTTGSVAWIPPVGAVTAAARINGGASVSLGSITAGMTPTAAVTLLDAVVGIDCTGGADRAVLTGATNVAVTVDGIDPKKATFVGSYAAAPSVGDTLVIAAGAAVAGSSSQNVGSWVVTSVVGATTFVAKKVADGTTGTPGTVTSPASVSSASTAAADFKCYAPIVISSTSASVSNGLGKSLELVEVAGTDLLSRCFADASGNAVSFVSTSAAPHAIPAAAETQITLNLTRSVDGVNDSITIGGEVGLQIGYTGTTASCQITGTQVILTSLGGTGAGTKTLNLKDFPTVNDLAAYISGLSGWKAKASTVASGNLSPAILDEGTFACATTNGAYVGRIKTDAYRFAQAVALGTKSCFAHKVGDATTGPSSGLPGVVAATYLAGGARGGTTQAAATGAIDALEKVRGNFVIPLFSRDATADIADGLTDASSTYTIDSLNAYVKSHVLKMSQVKRRRNRQAFLSKRDSFANVKTAAANIASFRCAMTFQDFKQATNLGTTQFQSWMGATVAAAMQAAGFYKSLVRKQINTVGALQAAGDWSDVSDGDVEAALQAGLLPAIRAPEGGVIWVSDQTTYGTDSNFVYNSIQMVYVADVVALTTAQRMEKRFVGKSLADVNAAVALSYLEGIMADFMRLKLIAPSDDAPLGFKNAKIVIEGPAMRVSLEVKIAGSIYWIPLTFYVTQITQTAAQK